MRRSRSGVWAALAVVAIVAASASFVLAATGPTGAGSGPYTDGPPDLSTVDEPVLVFDITLTERGNASWTITAVFPTDTVERAAAFDRLATQYRTDGGEAHLPVRPYERTVAEVDAELDRDMALTDVQRSVEREQKVGRLVLTFSWTGFAETTEDRIHHGDVYRTTTDGWFSELGDNEYLRVHPPANYTVEHSGGPVDNRSMWLAGPAELSPETLSAVFVNQSGSSPPPPPKKPPERSPSTIPFLLVGVSALTLLVAVAIVVVDRRPNELVTDAAATLPATVAGTLGLPRTNGNGDPEPADQESAEASPHPMEDPELLSDEERVLRLLEVNEGRMKQGRIVEETDWSNAKVSQLLSDLAEADRVEKLRIGRENLIMLPEEAEEVSDSVA